MRDRKCDHDGHGLRSIRSTTPRPEGAEAKQELHTKDGMQQYPQCRELTGISKAFSENRGSQDNRGEHYQRASGMGPDRNIVMPESGPQENLKKNHDRIQKNDGMN